MQKRDSNTAPGTAPWSPYFNNNKKSFIEISLTYKSCMYVKYTTWCFDTHTLCKMITRIKLIRTSIASHSCYCLYVLRLKIYPLVVYLWLQVYSTVLLTITTMWDINYITLLLNNERSSRGRVLPLECKCNTKAHSDGSQSDVFKGQKEELEWCKRKAERERWEIGSGFNRKSEMRKGQRRGDFENLEFMLSSMGNHRKICCAHELEDYALSFPKSDL